MGKGVSGLRSTTALVSVLAPTMSVNRSRQRRSNGITFENCVISNCGSGIVQVTRHRGPRLTDDIIEMEQPDYITRHIEERFLESAQTGYFQLGTLVNYRAN